MSMSSWSISGIGFPLYCGENEGKILDFLKNHEESIRRTWSIKEEVKKDFFASIEDAIEDGNFEKLRGVEPWELPEMIGAVINDEQGLHGVLGNPGCSDTDAPDNILYERMFPWESTQKEAALTEDDVTDIMKRYAEELGVDSDEVGFQDYEYYG